MTKRQGNPRKGPVSGGSSKAWLTSSKNWATWRTRGEQLKKSGEFHQQDVKGVYGFSVKVGLGDKGDQEIKVEPFGNVRRDESSGETVVQEIREPVVDVFEEKDHHPGGGRDARHQHQGREAGRSRTTCSPFIAEKQDKKYRKEILLPRSLSPGEDEDVLQQRHPGDQVQSLGTVGGD